MRQRTFHLLTIALLLSLVAASCTTPPLVQQDQPSVSSVPAEPTPEPTAIPATDTPAPEPTAAPAATTSGSDATSSSADASADEPDPLAIDPERPGFTADGSPTLGDPDAPIVIIDFSDFQ